MKSAERFLMCRPGDYHMLRFEIRLVRAEGEQWPGGVFAAKVGEADE